VNKTISADELARVTAFLAEQAAGFSSSASVGGMETAGGFVSYLACHPDKCEQWLTDPISAMPKDARFWLYGCLSWHGKDGEIHHPRDARDVEGVQQ